MVKIITFVQGNENQGRTFQLQEESREGLSIEGENGPGPAIESWIRAKPYRRKGIGNDSQQLFAFEC